MTSLKNARPHGLRRDQRPIINSKTDIPHTGKSLLVRPRLEARLEEAANRPLCLIRAPAGFGKTSLVAQWSRNQPGRVAWLNIDRLDNDPGCFGRYLVSTLQKALPELHPTFSQLLGELHRYDLTWLTGKLCNELDSLNQRLLLIIDDYQWIQNEQLHEAIRFLIQHQPPQLHLFILTRSEPPLGLANWRIRGILYELGTEELAFQTEEAGRFLSDHGAADIDPAQLDEVLQRLNGWAAGLRIIALSAPTQASLGAFLRHFNGTHAHVLDFLAEEVLGRQCRRQQEFLLKTSILDRFDAELATEVTGFPDCYLQLQEIEKQGLFIMPLDEYRRWYRYHPFFADFLRHQLNQRKKPHEIRQLHKRAHDWLFQHGQVAEALGHALLTDNRALIEQTLSAEGWSLFEQGHICLIRRCLEALDPPTITHNHQLTLLRAWVCLSQADPDSLNQVLTQAEQQIPEQLPDRKWRRMKAELHALRAQLFAIMENIPGARDEAMMALQTASVDTTGLETFTPQESGSVRTIAFSVLGEVDVCEGRLGEALERFQNAETASRSMHSTQSILWALAQQSDVLFHQGRLPEAHQRQSETLQLAEEHRLLQVPVMEFVHRHRAELLIEWLQYHEARQHCDQGLLCVEHLGGHCRIPINALLARIALIHEDLDTAGRLVNTNLDLLSQHSCHTDWCALAGNVQIRYWIVSGNEVSLRQWLSQQQPGPPGVSHFQQSQQRNIAMAMLASGFSGAALKILEPITKVSRERNMGLSELRNRLLCVWACQELGQTVEALTHLQRACILAEPMRVTGSFLELPECVLELGSQLADRTAGDELALTPQQQRHLLRVMELTRRQQRPPRKQDETPEPVKALALTPKEWQVLRLIGSGMSNEQIAETLFVAPSTIRSHIKHVYQKLGIGNRQEARRIAADLVRGRVPELPG